MTCPQCRAEVPAGFRFCGNCGARLDAPEVQPLRCAGCGFANPPGLQFCGHCGARLAGRQVPAPAAGQPAPLAPADAERRRVTVLFADVSGFTAMSEKLDPEAVFHVMNRCFERLGEPIARHEGTVDKYIGDCVMALFGAPVAHENDPERAVRAGLEMQQALRAFQAEAQEQTGATLRMRIGVNAGRVIAGEVGSEHKRQYTVMGDAVNLANRLESAAQPDTVLVSESVYRQTNRLFQYRAGQQIRVKGKAEPVLAFEVVGGKPDANGGGVGRPRTPCVGREAELALLQEALSSAQGGRGMVLDLSGASGIGKSRLLEELADMALEHQIGVLPAACRDSDAAVAYLPWRALLGRLCGIGEEDLQTSRRTKATEALTAVDPSLAEWLPYLSDVLGVSAEHDVVAAERKQSTQLAVCAVLRAVTRQQPLALVVDGAHWCDPLSAELLALVAAETVDLPLLVVTAHRSGFDPPWARLPHARQLVLGPLNEDSCAQLLACLLATPSVPPELVKLAAERGGGSPFFVEEMVGSLVEREVLVRQDGRWRLTRAVDQIELPESLEAVVTARIDRLSPAAKHALQCAAVIGRRFPVPLLEEVAGLEGQVESALSLLEGEDFVEEVQPPPQWECAFRQGLTHEVAYEMVLVQHRRTWHERIAQALEEVHADRLEEQCEILAYHYARSDNRRKAVEFLTRAGDKSLRVFALEAAEAFCRQAVETVGQLADPEECAEEAWRCQDGLADIATLRGDYDAAFAGYRALLAGPAPALPAARVACIRRKIGDVHARRGELPQAVEALQAALQTLAQTTDAAARQEEAAVWRELAAVSIRSGKVAEALEQAQRGLRLAEAIGSQRVIADCCLVLGVCCQTTGDHAAAEAYFRRSLRLREAAGNRVGIASALNNLGNLAADRGRYLEADEHYRRSFEMRQKMAHRQGMSAALVNRGNVAYNLGRYADAQEHYSGALELAQGTGDTRTAATARLDLGRVLLAVGQAEQAEEPLGAALEEAEERGFTDIAVLAHALLAETLAQRQRTDAVEHARGAVRLAQELGGRFHQAMAVRALGVTLACGQEAEEGEGHLRAALAAFEELGAEHEAGRTLVLLAERMAAPEERRLALARAAAVFQRLQAAGDLERLPPGQ
ncbi:MAG: adenylate/guanylate cyclase domain-containing protein [Candidatus Latescibacterota bacterium]